MPSLILADSHFRPWSALRLMWRMRNWSLKKIDSGYEMTDGGTHFVLTPHLASMTIAEWHGIWEKYYLPNFSLQNKTILDVGAACGETAYLYLKNGAKKVIAVEKDRERAALLSKNTERNAWNVEVVFSAFELGMLEAYQHDFLKMDIEGEERQLLAYEGSLKTCVLEVHEEELKTTLMRKFGLRVLKQTAADRYLLGMPTSAGSSKGNYAKT